MTESLYPEFLKWSKYTSKDEKQPDILNVKVVETETFEIEYSINVRAEVDGIEMNIPLHSFESKNKQLLSEWTKAVKEGKVKVGKKFQIKTWLGTSKNNFPIRRFELVF